MEAVPAAREAMLALRLQPNSKLHWHTESRARRAQLIKAIAELPALHVVAVRYGGLHEKGDRQRALCLRLLLGSLAASGVTSVTLESRHATGDSKDRRLADQLRRQRWIGSVSVQHRRGIDEPALWIADVTCGAALARTRGDNSLWAVLADTAPVTEIDVG